MSSVQTTITQLPQAGPILGTEAVPIVQGGQTRQTTTGAIAAANLSTQTFLTVNQEPTLANSQYLSTGTGLGLEDGGAQSYLRIVLNGASASLETALDGFMVKTAINTLTPRSIEISGDGISIVDGDGQAGNPTISLDGLPASLAGMSGSGLVTVLNGATLTPRSIDGVSNQTSVTNGNAFAGNPTIGLADNPVLPGTQSVTVPSGTTAQRAGASAGQLRYNTTTSRLEWYSTEWYNVGGGDGTVTSVSGVSNEITIANPTTTPIIGIADDVVLPGTGAMTIPKGTNAEEPIGTDGQLRYNTSEGGFFGYSAGQWRQFSLSGGVILVDTGTGLTGGPITSSGTISIDETVVATLSGIQTLTNKTISGASNTLSNIANSSLTNSSITLNGVTIALGDTSTITANTTNALTIGTGLTGASFNGSAAVTIALANTAVTTGTYGSSNYVPTFTVDQQGRLTAASETEITPSGIGAISQVDGTADQITSSQVGTVVTLAIADAPVLVGPVKVKGTGATSITPFAQSMGVFEANDNSYQEVYARNLNNGSDASADFIAYNDASDLNSYFIDMGMNSSNFTSTSYPIFTPNSGYLFTGGGLSGQQSDLFIGTSNPASDIIFFTGDVQPSNQRAMFNGTTGNLLLNTATDTGYTLNVNGTTYFGGASTFGSTVLLNADPTLALQAATKQYVDNATSTGIHIHTPVAAETSAALSAVYTQGGTTFNITDITGGNTVTTSSAHGLSVNNQIWLTTTAGNGLSINTAYFVYSTPSSTQLTLSTTYGGSQLTGLTNATGLSYATRANSGVGAYLEASANATLPIAGVSVSDRVLVYNQLTGYWNGVYTVTSLGSGASKWKLTRATDADYYSPADTDGLSEGDYFFVQSNSESYVLTTPGAIIIGYTSITYTLFSSVPLYTGGTNIDVSGGVISLTGTVAATNGGTGTNTVAVGDLLYGSATDTWSKLALGSAYKSLVVNASGTQLEWNAVALNQASAVSGQLGAGNGGTGIASYTDGDILYATATTTLSKLGLGTQGQVLTAGASGPTWSGIAGGTF